MATGSVDLVKELRERTGAGIMDCKAALQASGGDIEKAIDVIRKKGMASSAKRAGREAKEGLVLARNDGHKAALVEANCETDFVARTEDFRNLATLALDEAMRSGEAAANADRVTQRVAELSGKIGEKILVKRAKVVETKTGAFFTYVHSNQKLGVIIEIEAAKPGSMKHTAFQELGKNLAMQVAASNPLCLIRSEVPNATLDREKAIFREEVKGKPDNIVEKIVLGKLEKFYQGNCLLDQPFIREDKKSVKQLVEETSKILGDTVSVRRFVRFQLGESAAS